MDYCLLCLEINKDFLDTIKTNSKRWQELNMAKVIERHFWPMTTIQPYSWICLSCWQGVDEFHKFYLRIEEAHVNFRNIKIEDCASSVDFKDDEINGSYCFLEPEMLIDEHQPHELVETDLLTDDPHTDMPNNKETALSETLDDMPLKKLSKRLRLQENRKSKDPLKKSENLKIDKTKKRKHSTEKKPSDDKTDNSDVKEEPEDLNDSESDSSSDNDNSATDANYQPEKDDTDTLDDKKRKACSKNRTSRKELDEFIAEHFKHMFCDLCQVPFKDFAEMQKHFTKNHKTQGYVVCCKRKYFGRARLIDHIHCHLNPDHFKCTQCGKAMSDRVSFENHMLCVHKPEEVVKQHCCELCGKSFKKAYVLRIHKLTHLPEEEKKFPCSDCGKNYGSTYHLNQHIQAVHLKRFAKICYICGKAINSTAEFKVHMNKHEGITANNISCDICGLRLTSERGLKLHKESQHPVGGKQEHQCPICPKISPGKKALQKHIRTMHQKGYDHKCSICEKAFKRPESLREHMASHTGTTLYTCPWCPKTFNSNGNMHAHRKKVHPKEWEKSKLEKYSGKMPPESFWTNESSANC